MLWKAFWKWSEGKLEERGLSGVMKDKSYALSRKSVRVQVGRIVT